LHVSLEVAACRRGSTTEVFMTRTLNRLAGMAVAATLLGAPAAFAQNPVRAVFDFEAAFRMDLAGHELPAGSYQLERIGNTAFFRLYEDERGANPIAVIDTWNTRIPDTVNEGASGAQAVLKVLDPKTGETVRLLEGFYIDGSYYKVRDIVSIEMDEITSG
jgi:hypothetical protein